MEFAPAKKHNACISSFILSLPADNLTKVFGIVILEIAITLMKSKLSTFSFSEYGVPSIFTSLFIGTDSGCSSILQSTSISFSRSIFSSPRPNIPPVHTFIPASLT